MNGGGRGVRARRSCASPTRAAMVSARSVRLFVLLALLALVAAGPAPRVRRQLADDDNLQPLEDADGDEQTREKRKLEPITQAKFGIKNAVLGFVFGSGTTWRDPASTSSSTLRDSPSGSPSRSLRVKRQKEDDIPEFDRNKVSLDLPGSLFGPSVSLLIRTTKIIGDVIQNSAVRYQTFLRLFQPLFRGPFEIKGLDPPTTTTTTPAPPASDNEVRRR